MSSLQNSAEETWELNYIFKLSDQFQSPTISCFIWNAQSLNNKVHLFIEFLEDNQIDIACITETWFSDEGNITTFAIKEAGYEIEHTYRDKRGAGVCIIWKPPTY